MTVASFFMVSAVLPWFAARKSRIARWYACWSARASGSLPGLLFAHSVIGSPAMNGLLAMQPAAL